MINVAGERERKKDVEKNRPEIAGKKMAVQSHYNALLQMCYTVGLINIPTTVTLILTVLNKLR